VSALEPRDDGAVDVRLVNLGTRERSVRVRWLGAPRYELVPVDLAGRSAERDATQESVTGERRLALGPWQIATLRATPLS